MQPYVLIDHTAEVEDLLLLPLLGVMLFPRRAARMAGAGGCNGGWETRWLARSGGSHTSRAYGADGTEWHQAGEGNGAKEGSRKGGGDPAQQPTPTLGRKPREILPIAIL